MGKKCCGCATRWPIDFWDTALRTMDHCVTETHCAYLPPPPSAKHPLRMRWVLLVWSTVAMPIEGFNQAANQWRETQHASLQAPPVT